MQTVLIIYIDLFSRHFSCQFCKPFFDQERYVEGAVEIINRTLDKTGLIPDEGPDKDKGAGPYVQSERPALASMSIFLHSERLSACSILTSTSG